MLKVKATLRQKATFVVQQFRQEFEVRPKNEFRLAIFTIKLFCFSVSSKNVQKDCKKRAEKVLKFFFLASMFLQVPEM